jgi:hypothetical protein
MLAAVEKMRLLLVKYYERTEVPSVYIDGMILNPRTKMIIFEEESWSDINAAEYQAQSRQRFQVEYELSGTTDTGPSTSSRSQSLNGKRSASNYSNDQEYRASLVARSSKRRRNDFDRYIEIPNDPGILSCLGWWRQNEHSYPDLAMMARDTLAVPASGCLVERQFSISGRMAIWQRNRLSALTISNAMMYKAALTKTRRPLREQVPLEDDVDTESLAVAEKEGTIPEEWIQDWWLKKVGKLPVGQEMIDGMFGARLANSEEEKEDLYG